MKILRVRSRRVVSSGASISVELGAGSPGMWMGSPTQSLSKNHRWRGFIGMIVAGGDKVKLLFLEIRGWCWKFLIKAWSFWPPAPAWGYLRPCQESLVTTKDTPVTLITQEIPKVLGTVCQEPDEDQISFLLYHTDNVYILFHNYNSSYLLCLWINFWNWESCISFFTSIFFPEFSNWLHFFLHYFPLPIPNLFPNLS